MKKYHIIISVLLLLFVTQTQAQIDEFNKYSREVLTASVYNGKVDYKVLAKNPTNLNNVIDALKYIQLQELKGTEKKAFLINTYNMLILHAIASNYPTTSVMKIPGFFDRKTFRIGEEDYTLNQLEKEILYKEFPDPQLHFALVCGAVSCPPLGSKPFTAGNLESELKNVTRRALNSDKIVSLDMHEKTVTVSKIFDWYKADFTKSGSTIDFINMYRMDKIPSGISLNYADYSWELNGK